MTANEQLRMIVRTIPEKYLSGLIQVMRDCRKELRPWEGDILDKDSKVKGNILKC